MAERNENNLLRDAFVRHQIGLLRVAAGYVDSAQDLVDSSEPRLRMLIERFLGILQDERVDLTATSVQNRLDTLRRQIEELRTEALRAAEEDAEEQFRLLILAQWAWFGGTVGTITGGRLTPSAPGGRALARDMLADMPFEGRTFRQWMRDLARADANRIYGAVVVGLMQNRSRRDILRSVFGSARLNGADGVTQKTRHDLASVIATANAHFSAQAIDAMAAENAEMFPRDIYTAVLDGRTTPICRSLDGKVYLRGKGPIPPLHFYCRSIRVPLLPGQLPTRTTYPEWLAAQPAAFQDEVLGKARGLLFRRGGLTLDKFVDRNGRLFTLKELAAMDRAAFKAAGLDPDQFLR